MVTPAAYLGATFTLLMTLGSAAGAVIVAFYVNAEPSKVLGFVITLGILSLICGSMVIRNDWPRVWKPLLAGKS